MSLKRRNENKTRMTLELLPTLEKEPTIEASSLRKLSKRTTITIGDTTFDCNADDLEKICVLGRGGYGVVEKVRHIKSGTIMAMKILRLTVDNEQQKRVCMDLDISMRSLECPNIVMFYGAMFRERDVLICMEVMETSLDKFYQIVFKHNRTIPEYFLGKIFVAVVNALHFLKIKLKVIHRDVKPSNMLLNRNGEIKMCDFGISGQLVNSIAKTTDLGCKPYMAPERIDPDGNTSKYNIKSDVWSLGISMIEIATGKFPYKIWTNPFEQMSEVLEGDAPRLTSSEFSDKFKDVITKCLQKTVIDRPNYEELLNDPFIVEHTKKEANIAGFIEEILNLETEK